MRFLSKYADNTNSSSLVNKWRKKRFIVFEELIRELPKPVKILDAGGTENFWLQMGWAGNNDYLITLINTEEIKTTYPNIKYIKGSAANLCMFSDNEFDVVFSNSVIEHVGDFNEQKKMADEVQRTGKTFFVQTPNYYFFMEPHFLFPFFQFLPRRIKIFMVMNFNMGWFPKCRDNNSAKTVVDSINLLSKKQLKKLFPHSVVKKEKFLFFTKSFMILSSSKNNF